MDTSDPHASDAAATPVFLKWPLRDLRTWVRHFMRAEIPVLASTAQALEELRAREDDIGPGDLGPVLRADPLMTVKFMAHVATLRRDEDDTETESITSALVMTGITPFFNRFGPQPTVEDRLREQPEALAALYEVLQRSERAAHFAMAFAVHRSDTDVDMIHEAAFLHDFAELLMWCHAPDLMLQVRQAQQRDPGLRSVLAQRSLLNVELDDLRQALLRLWHLPRLLIRISDGKHADHPSVQNVVLASRLARHTMKGWDNPALGSDVEELSRLLNASPRVTLAFLHKVDSASAPG